MVIMSFTFGGITMSKRLNETESVSPWPFLNKGSPLLSRSKVTAYCAYNMNRYQKYKLLLPDFYKLMMMKMMLPCFSGPARISGLCCFSVVDGPSSAGVYRLEGSVKVMTITSIS